MFLSSGAAIRQRIEAMLDDGLPLDCAVAYWGHGVALTLSRGSRVLCDLFSGGCNPDAIRALLAHPGEIAVKTLHGLHAKVVSGPMGVIISSANMSLNGLGALGLASRNTEAGWWLDAGSDPSSCQVVQHWFAAHWAAATDITPDMLDAVCAIRQSAAPALGQMREDLAKARRAFTPQGSQQQPTQAATLAEMWLEAALKSHCVHRALKPEVLQHLHQQVLPDQSVQDAGRHGTRAIHALLLVLEEDVPLHNRYGPLSLGKYLQAFHAAERSAVRRVLERVAAEPAVLAADAVLAARLVLAAQACLTRLDQQIV